MTRYESDRVRAVLLATLTLLSAVAGVAAFGGTAYAQSGDVLVVDANATPDPENGTYVTISDALANASAGDTIEVQPGTYEERVVVDTDNVSIVAAGDGEAIVRYEQPADTNNPGYPTFDIRADNVTIDGFTVQLNTSDAYDGSLRYAQGVKVGGFQAAGGSGVEIVNNDVQFLGDRNENISTIGVGLLEPDDDTGLAGATVENNDVSDFEFGVLTNGNVSNVNAASNSFETNDVQVLDGAGALDLDTVLDGNEFDRAVVVRSNGDAAGSSIFSSVQDGVDAASSGDTVDVRPGTYEERVVVDTENVSIVAAGNGEAIVRYEQPADTNNPGYPTFDVRADNVTIDGFTVQLNTSDAYDGGLRHAQGVKVGGFNAAGGSGVVVVNNDIQFLGERNADISTIGVGLLEPDDGTELAGATVENNAVTGFEYGALTNGNVSNVALSSTSFEDNDIQVVDAAGALDLGQAIDANAFDRLVTVADESGTLQHTLYTSVEDGVRAVEENGTVEIYAGEYRITNGTVGDRLQIETDGITVSGAGESEVTINATAQWGIYVTGTDGVVLEGFTVDGVDKGWGSATVKSDFSENLAVHNVTATEGYIGFDLNNVRNATLADVTATGNSALGASLSGVENVTFDGLTTQGSTWGGVGIFESDATRAGWDNITVSDGVTITDHASTGEPIPVYTQSATSDDVGDLVIDDATHLVENPNHKPEGDPARDDYFAFYLHSESDAVGYATDEGAHADTSTTTVRPIVRDADGVVSAGDTFVVEDGMSIQAAIDAAGESATIDVGPGTYEESLSIGVENLTLSGPNAGVPAYSSQRGPEATVDANGSDWAIRIQEQSGNVTVDGFAVEGWTQVGILQGMSDSEGTSAHVSNNDVDVTGQPVAHGNSIQVTGDHSTVVGNDVEVTGYDYDETDWATSGILAEGVNDTEIVRNHVEYVDTGDVSKYYRGITVEGVSSFDGPANDNVVRNNTVVGLSTAISIQMDASNTTVEDNTVVDSDVGLAVRMYQTRGENNLVDSIAPTGVTVESNSFDNNDVQVDDSEAVLDLVGVLDTNEFDRAVTVDGSVNIYGAIQPAVDEAESGDTVHVSSGIYDENVVIDTSITLAGAGAGQTVIAPGSGQAISIENVTNGNRIKVDDVAVRNLSVVAPDGNTIGLIAVSEVDDDYETGNLTVENVYAQGGIAPFALFDTERATFDNVTVRDVESAIGAFEVGGVGDLTITDSHIENTTTGVKFNDFTDLGYQPSGSLTIAGSTFDGNDVHVNVTSGIDAANVTLQENAFRNDGQSSGTALAVDNDGNGAVDATFNYWGADDGPSGAAPGDGAAVSENVEYRPWQQTDGSLSGSITLYVNASATGPANGSQEAPYSTIDDALDAAIAGDTIFLQNGTYDRSSTLTISQNDTTIVGESRAGVVIDTSDIAGYGIETPDDGNVTGLTIRKLTVVGPQQDRADTYAFKINPTTKHVTIQNVTVTDSHRTGIDFNGVDDVFIEDVSVSGTASGNGIAFADTRSVFVDNVTVENNSWGGIALYTNDDAPEQGTHDVTILNSTIRNNSGIGMYAQNSGEVGNPFVNVSVFDSQFAGNGVQVAELDTENNVKTSIDWFDFDTVVGANDFDHAVVVRDGDGPTVPAVFSTIQPAVDAAEDGDAVEAGPGTYEENVVIDTSIALHGAGAGQTVIAPGSGAAISVENVTNGNRIKVDDVAVGNLSIDAPDSSEIGLIAVSAAGDGDYETGNLTVANVVVEGGLASFGVFDTERATFHNVTVRDVESSVGAFEVGGVADLAIIDSRIENTTTGVKFNDFTGLGYQPSESLVIVASTFDGNDVHLDVTAGIDAANVTLRESTFLNDGQSSGAAVAVDNDGDGAVDAAWNYWGASTGPGGVAPGDGAGVSENITFRPFYTNAAMSENSSVPPEISDVQLIDLTDGDGTVGDGDTVRVSANVTDVSGVASVTIDARPFGGSEDVALTDEDGDGVYEAEFTVSAAEANVDGDWSLSITAFDYGGATASASTNALALSTDSETRTSFTVSDATPLNTEVVDVTVTIENVGERSADRTLTLIVDGEDAASKSVTVPANSNRTVTFERKFSTGTHAVTVNDSVYTLSAKTVVAERASNPDAGIDITAPESGDAFATDEVTVEYDLIDADAGIAAVNYSVGDGEERTVTDLDATNVTLTELGDGSHTVEFWLIDHLGNDLSGDSVTFTVDSTEPVVEIEPARADSIGANRSVSVNLNVADDNPDEARFIVRNAGGTEVYTEDLSDELADGSETITWDGTDDADDPLATGQYDLVLNATDDVGLSNETTVEVAVDNSPPTATVGELSTLYIGSDGNVTVNVTANDADGVNSGVSSVSVTLDSKADNFRTTRAATNDSGTWRATFDAANLSLDGNYTVQATATDGANNDGTVAGTEEIAVDTTAPSVSAILDTKNDTHGYVNVTVADDVGGAEDIELELTNSTDDSVDISDLDDPESDGTYSGTFAFEGSGQYDLAVNATDEAGNVGNSTATANFSVLEDADQHTITGADGTEVILNMKNPSGGLAAITSSDSPLAELGTNVGSTFINGELNESLTNNLENATIRIPVEGNEIEGVPNDEINISRYNESTDEWVLLPTEVEDIDGTDYFVTTVEHFSTYGSVAPDTTAPSIDATALAPSESPLPYSTSTVDVTVEYSDNKQVDANNVTVLWNGSDVTDADETSVSSSEATFRATDLVGSGQHWVNVTVVDTADNAETENVSFTVEQDTDAPDVTRQFQSTFDYGTQSVPVEFTFDDPLSGVDKSSVEIEIDGSSVDNANATVTTAGIEYDATGLNPGTHSVVLNVSDHEGNDVTVQEAFTIETDVDGPTVTATTIAPTPIDGVLPMGTSQATVELQYADAASGIDASAIEVSFDGEDVTDDAVITASKLTYTVVGLENGTTHTLSADVYDAEGNVVTETVTFEIDAPSVDDGDSDGGDGSRPFVSDRPADRLSRFLNDGETTFEVGATVSRFGVDFADRSASGTVSVQSLDARPESVVPIPDAAEIAFVDVSVPSRLADSEATLRLTVDADAVGDVAPSSLVVYHHEDGEWTALETSVVSTADGEVVLEATTPGFSLFAVGSVQEETTTEPATETPEPATETPEPGTETPEPGTPTPEPAVETDEPIQEPAGFGVATALVVVLVLAVLLAVYYVRTRRE